MSESVRNITIQGPAPYGFRLTGGDGKPLTIVKLRQKSKAYEGGLREGDVLLGVNGLSCETLSHAQAAELLESSINQLQLHVIRDTRADVISSAFQSLSAVLQKPPASSVLQSNGLIPEPDTTNKQPISSMLTSNCSIQQPMALTVTNMTSQITSSVSQPQFAVNGLRVENADQELLHTTQQNFFIQGQGQVPEDIKDEFKDKEEIIVYRHKPNMPGEETKMSVVNIKLPPVEPQNKDDEEEDCIPRRGCTAVSLAILPDNNDAGGSLAYTGGGPSIVPKLKPFDSFTNSAITKDDLASFVKFQISQFPGQPLLWHPSQVYKVNSKPLMEDFKLDSVTREDIERIREELIAKHLPHGVSGGERKGGSAETDDDIPLYLLKILTTIEDVDPMFWKKKKIYSDSTFYDDSRHTYPTIQEQIKMARSVAKSLTSTDNVKARGHQMFIKRMERAQYWDIDHPAYHRHISRSLSDEPFYNRKPWKAPERIIKPWEVPERETKRWKVPEKPEKQIVEISWEKKLEEVKAFKPFIATSPSAGKPEIVWGPKLKVPDVLQKNESKTIVKSVTNIPEKESQVEITKSMSEVTLKPRRKGKKFTPVGKGLVGQPVAYGAQRFDFTQTDELLNKSGKAGQLFAQRRAKSEEPGDLQPMFEVEQDAPAQRHQRRTQVALNRPLKVALEEVGRGRVESANHPGNGEVSQCRLKEMIAEYSLMNNAWDCGSSLRRTEALFSNGHNVTASTTVREAKRTKGENGLKLKLKSSRGYRPVNFKAPLVVLLSPSPVESHRVTPYEISEPAAPCEVSLCDDLASPAEQGQKVLDDGGITDF